MVGKHVKCGVTKKNGAVVLNESDSKKIFNNTWTQDTKPVEVYRKDYITAMKIPSHQTLTGDFIKISDSWKGEYDKGVQVPVDIESLPNPSFSTVNRDYELVPWSLPNKYVKWQPTQSLMDVVAGGGVPPAVYDMDDEDSIFLSSLGGEVLSEGQFEQIVTYLDVVAHVNMLEKYRENLSYSIQYDDTVSCDVCKDVYSEPENEMIFCDSCNICVHQGCYGITSVPTGEWFCGPCKARCPTPVCLLCLHGEGAFKATGNGEWVHVFCALWIPEVGFGNVEKMEPITRIKQIHPTRWALSCSFCQEKVGACIQCSGEECYTSFHPSCAYENRCYMKTCYGETEIDPVENFAYCLKHTEGKEEGEVPANTIVLPLNHKKDLNPMYNNETKIMRNIQKMFYEFVDILDTSTALDIDVSVVQSVFGYWKRKRKGNGNHPLISELPPLNEVVEKSLKPVSKNSDPQLDPFFKLVSLRQDLERARALLYMCERRERHKKRLLKSIQSFVEGVISTDHPEPVTITRQRNSEGMKGDPANDSLNISHSKIICSPLKPIHQSGEAGVMLVENETVILSEAEKEREASRMKELARKFSKKIVIAFSEQSDANNTQSDAETGHYSTPPNSPEFGDGSRVEKRKRGTSGSDKYMTPPSPFETTRPISSSPNESQQSPRTRQPSKRHKPNPKYQSPYFT